MADGDAKTKEYKAQTWIHRVDIRVYRRDRWSQIGRVFDTSAHVVIVDACHCVNRFPGQWIGGEC